MNAIIRKMPLAFDELERKAVRAIQAAIAGGATPLLDQVCAVMTAAGLVEPLKLIDRLQAIGWLEIDDDQRLHRLG